MFYFSTTVKLTKFTIYTFICVIVTPLQGKPVNVLSRRESLGLSWPPDFSLALEVCKNHQAAPSLWKRCKLHHLPKAVYSAELQQPTDNFAAHKPPKKTEMKPQSSI